MYYRWLRAYVTWLFECNIMNVTFENRVTAELDQTLSNVTTQATSLIRRFRDLDADDIGNLTIPELPHHALLDARLLAGLYRELAPTVEQ